MTDRPIHFGVTPFEDIAHLTGLEYIRGICDGRYAAPTIGRTMGFRMAEVAEGRVVFEGAPSAEVMNPIGTVHGGYAATMLDSALACAVHTICPAGHASTSVNLQVSFIRPIAPDIGTVRCEGVVVHPGRQLATAEARLTGPDGKLLATGTQTCSVFRIPSTPPAATG